MSTITVSQLNITGAELFVDSESFINELDTIDATAVHGGEIDEDDSHYALEFGLSVFGLDVLNSIVKSFSSPPSSGG